MAKGSVVRISSLLWADILVGFAFFVMQNYLTDIWGLSFTRAAAIMNFYGGICLILPLFSLYLVDELWGNFIMLAISSICYSIGIVFVFLSTPPIIADSTGTCKQVESKCIGHTQKVLFYAGMALVAIGVSGNKISVQPFLDEQKDETTKQKDKSKGMLDITCGQIAGLIFVTLIAISGAIALPYIKPWALRFGIPAFFTVLAMFLFLSGSCGPLKYEMKEPKGSPITRVCRVFVVCISNISKPFPPNAKLYKQDEQKSQEFTRTRFLRCIEKAAIINTDEKKKTREPCSVAEVEEAKIAVRMIPMWMTFIMCGIVSSIGNTYFVEQANHMNRNIGQWKVPLQMLLFLSKGAKIVFTSFANYLLTKGDKPRKGKAPVVGNAVAMIFSVLCCITAAKIEKRRLNVIIRHGLLDKPDDNIPMSVYWLLFQFFLLAGLDAFLEKSVVAFYAYQAPKSMRDYLEHFTNGVTGLGFMFSVLSVYVVGRVSKNGGNMNWFQFTLSRSRLDRYYWVLAVLSSANLVIFVVVACIYRYQNFDVDENENEAGEQEEKAGDEGGDNNDGNNGEGDDNDGRNECCCC